MEPKGTTLTEGDNISRSGDSIRQRWHKPKVTTITEVVTTIAKGGISQRWHKPKVTTITEVVTTLAKGGISQT